MNKNIPKTRPVWVDELIAELATKKETARFKDEILNAVDEVMGELKDFREEQTLIGERLSLHSDQLENHETRIGKLEKSGFA